MNKFKVSGTDIKFWHEFVVPFIQKRDNYACVTCGSDKYLCVHHKRYGNNNDPLDVTCDDLETLCKGCHQKLHSENDG